MAHKLVYALITEENTRSEGYALMKGIFSSLPVNDRDRCLVIPIMTIPKLFNSAAYDEALNVCFSCLPLACDPSLFFSMCLYPDDRSWTCCWQPLILSRSCRCGQNALFGRGAVSFLAN